MEITKLASALVKAQAEMDGAKKDSNNPFFKSKYADLSSVAQAIGPAASKYGLGYVQVSHERENAAAVETIIVHESGETMSCGVVSCPVSKADAQGYGSAMTYARRYSLSAAFGVCPEDDDGNAAAKAKPAPSPKVAAYSGLPALLAAVKEADSAEVLAAIWKTGVAEIKTAGDIAAYTEFKLAIGARGEQLKKASNPSAADPFVTDMEAAEVAA